MFSFFSRRLLNFSTLSEDKSDFLYKYTADIFLDYYNMVSPLSDAVDKITKASSIIEPYIKSQEQVDFYKFSTKPNSKQTGKQFRKEALTHFLVTGNNFIEVKYKIDSKKNKKIYEINNLNPRFVKIHKQYNDEISYYIFNKNNIEIKYNKILNTKNFENPIRYQYEDNGFIYDLIHYKELEDNELNTVQIKSGWGRSKLEPLQNELDLYVQSNTHNRATIRQAISAKKMFKIDRSKMPAGIKAEEFNAWLKDLTEKYSGSINSGKTLFTTLDVSQVDLQNPFMARDLEFNVGLRRLRVAIYNAFDIPLPKVEGEFTSNSNMKESNLNFYDEAVLPNLESYYDFINVFLFQDFYPEAKVEKVFYASSEIPVLAERNASLVNKLSISKILTQNELRKKFDLDRIEGLDAIYIDGNQAPIGVDTNTGDAIGTPLSQQKDLFFEDIDDYEIELLENEEKALSDIDLKPTESMANNARRGLELREKFGRGGTAVGVARARDISNRKNLSPSTIGRMVSFFARHGVNEGKNKLPNGDPSNHYIAWLLWGGNSGRTWANDKWKAIKREREK